MLKISWPIFRGVTAKANARVSEGAPEAFTKAAQAVQVEVPQPVGLLERAQRTVAALAEKAPRKAKPKVTEKEWRDRRGSLAPMARRAFLAGAVGLTVTAMAQDQAGAASAGRLRFARPMAAPPSGLLFPSASWDGTAGSGFSPAQLVALEDPIRTGPKMILRPLQPPEVAFTEDHTLVASAASFDGVDTVEIWCEGNYVAQANRGWFDDVAPDGSTFQRYGFGATLDHSVIQAFGFAEGAMHIYFKAPTPAGSTIQPRVMGPYLYYARNPGVGAGCEYDFSVFVKPGATTQPGIRYPTIVSALLYCSQQSKLRPRLVLEDTARYTTAGNIAAAAHTGSMWWTLEPAAGVTATLGNWDINDTVGTSWYCDNLHFKGDIVLELAAMAPRMGSMYRGWSGGQNKLWIDGCEVTGGSYVGSGYAGGLGSGQDISYYGAVQASYFFNRNNTNPFNFYFTHMYMHDLPGYMIDSSLLILNCDVARCSGTAIENNFGAIHGLRVSEVGGIQSGARSFVEVFRLSYTGPAALAQFNKSTANGRATYSGSPTVYPLTFWEDNVKVGEIYTVPPGSSGYTTMQILVNYINSLPGWTATATGGARDMAWGAEYISVADMVPSAGVGIPGESGQPFSKRTITSTPLSMCRIADVHANGLTWDGALLAQNVTVEFVEGFNITSAAHMGASTVKDFCARWCTFQDTSAAYQIAHPTHNPVVGAQASIYGGTSNHFLVSAVTYEGPGQQVLTQSATVMDAKSRIARSIFEVLSINNVANRPGLNGVVLRTGALPSGADALSKTLAGAYTETFLFADPFGAIPSYDPVATQLQLSDGTWAGARLPAVLHSPANNGWNLAAA